MGKTFYYFYIESFLDYFEDDTVEASRLSNDSEFHKNKLSC